MPKKVLRKFKSGTFDTELKDNPKKTEKGQPDQDDDATEKKSQPPNLPTGETDSDSADESEVDSVQGECGIKIDNLVTKAPPTTPISHEEEKGDERQEPQPPVLRAPLIKPQVSMIKKLTSMQLGQKTKTADEIAQEKRDRERSIQDNYDNVMNHELYFKFIKEARNRQSTLT